jgi:protein phosphatase 1L
VKGLQNVGCKEDGQLEEAIRGGYLVTDREFLSQVNFQLSMLKTTL